MADLSDLYLRFTFDMVASQPFEHLHWGLFRDVPKEPGRLAEAQQAYADHLLTLVPAQAQHVLDVGCGLGGLARMLTHSGRRVLGISPRQDHCELLRASAVPNLEVQCTRLQDLAPARPMDLLLFAESFNFVADQLAHAPVDRIEALAALVRPHLAADGYLLIADVLTPDTVGALRDSARFQLLHDEDVHDEVAYTAQALQARFDRQAMPFHRLLMDTLAEVDPDLAQQLRSRLARLPNQALQRLFAGRMVELDQADQRRYVMMLLRMRP